MAHAFYSPSMSLPARGSLKPRLARLLPGLLACLLVMLFTSAKLALAQVTLVDDTTPACPVVYGAKESRPIIHGARDLARYLSMITGKEFKAVAVGEGQPIPARAVIVGSLGAKDLPKLRHSAFLIRTEGQRLRIVGGSEPGTLYGVYGFLEDDLGCRWWTHNEEFVPRTGRIVIPEMDRVTTPAFEEHDLFNREAMQAPYKMRTSRQGADRFTGSHTLNPMLKPHTEKHPEFLPMNDKGERKFNNLHMNYTAPAMPEKLAEELEKVIKQNGGRTDYHIYFAGMGDWYGGMDLSPESKAVYEKETWTDPDGRKRPGYTATLLNMINRTAEILEEKYPGVMVGTFAYMSLEAPPATVKPRHNVVIRVPRLRHATVRSVNESPKNKGFMRNLERWCQIAPGRVYVWEYGANFHSFLVPFPCLYSIADNLKTYKKVGVTGVMIQGNYVSTGGDLAGVKNYVWRKLMWNTDLDPKALVQEFCEGYYGAAAPAMIRYIETLEAGVRGETPSDADEFAKPGAFLKPATIAALKAIAEEARGLAPDLDSVTRRRVEEAVVGLDALELLKPLPTKDPFVEKDGKLYRTDMKDYTFDRVVNLVKHLRGASPTEWGSGRAYHMNFLAQHGGPVWYVQSGDASVRLAPAVAGLVGPFRLGEKTIPITFIATTQVGGARTMERSEKPLMAPGSDSAKPQPRPQVPGAITMQGDAGVALFGSSTKFMLNVQVAPAADGAGFEVQAFSRRVAREAEFDMTSARFVTRYPNARAVTVQKRVAGSGEWVEVDLTQVRVPAPDKKSRAKPAPIKPLTVSDADGLKVVGDAWIATDTYRPVPQQEPAGKVNFSITTDPATNELVITSVGPRVPVAPDCDTLCLSRIISVGAK